MIKTLIFDLGKVIVDFDHSKIVEIAAKHCEFDVADIREQLFSSELTKEYELGKISTEQFHKRVRDLLNLQMSLDEFRHAWNATFSLTPILPEKLFDKLSNKYRLLILSDTNEMHFEFIRENFAALNYFENLVLSYRVGALKPSSEIFNAVIEVAGCLPSECFFTDDRLPNVEGAKSCGIEAVLFETVEQFENDLQSMKLM